ncbi:hypothetical protein COLO4_37454 [Corchorus olitorius]|uniref:Uncharacterized protein n=1 Tax=Corchorus olitorius TaxID=93759 RepID=A0A1R3G1N3_9ROSI|nr:hypothetical protein COLO4_37454 [Corchorus olitorius]
MTMIMDKDSDSFKVLDDGKRILDGSPLKKFKLKGTKKIMIRLRPIDSEYACEEL